MLNIEHEKGSLKLQSLKFSQKFLLLDEQLLGRFKSNLVKKVQQKIAAINVLKDIKWSLK